MKTETFFFNNMSGFHNVSRLIIDEDSGINMLTLEEGYAKMVHGEDKVITLDFSTFNENRDVNLKSMRNMALSILKVIDGECFELKPKDSLMNQIKTRVSHYKYLREYLSSIEICYVEFTDGTSCLIGDPIREELETTDTLHLKEALINVEDSVCYSLEGMGILTSIIKYFETKLKKTVKGAYVINSVTLFENVKNIFEN